ncbi:hypothetical protein [Algimonas ampicilliniresistens]|nr:hypothetical protein [Algimonas ampicilliniresistens]
MTDKRPETMQPDAKAGFEELLEDLFGLNIRSFQSFKTLFTSPVRYFNAAKTLDWGRQSFTPSPRLWLGLIAITAATRFFWGEADGAFMQAMSAQAEAGFNAGAGDKASEIVQIDWDQSLQEMFDITLIIEPFFMVVIMMLLATFIRFWGEPLTYVVRLRYLFAIIIPATLVNLVLTILVVMAPKNWIVTLSILQIGVMVGLYTMTALRGPFAGQPLDSAVPKSIVLMLILFVSVFVANLLASLIAMTIVIAPDAIEAARAAKDAGLLQAP